MVSAVKLLATLVVLVGFVGGQQCNELVCPGNGCLTRDSVCNGNDECPDGRGSYFDETNCSGSKYTCINGTEILVDMLCDGMNDCGDNSDENGTLCIGSNYTCINGIEILVDMLCDGMNDCGDNSDENGTLCIATITPTPTTSSTTPTTSSTTPTTSSTTPSPNSNDDDGYDLVIPRLVLFILIPIFVIMVLIVVLSIIFVCLWRRYKLKNMKYRVRVVETARIRKDTLEQSRLTQGTYRNAYAETSFTAMGQSSPPVPQPQSSPPVPQWRPPISPLQSPVPQWQPPVPQWQPPVPQWQPPAPSSQSPIPQWRPPVPRSQSPVPRSPAPLPPISRQHKPPAPPPPPDELTPLQSTTDVTIEAQVPPSITGIANRTSTMSGAFDILAAVTAAEAAKRRSTVSGGGGMNPTASKSKLQQSTSSRSAFQSLGGKEQPTTPPSSPPPPPINDILPPPVAPKPKKHVNQQKAQGTNVDPEDTYEDTISNLEPLYEQIPGDQLEQEGTDYVDVVPPPFVDENIYDDDAGIHAMQEAEFNVPYDTSNVPTSQPGSYDTYDVPTSQPTSPDSCDVPISQPISSDTGDVPTLQPTSSDTYDVPTSQHPSYDTYDVPTSQHPSYNASDVPTSQHPSYNASDVPTSQPSSYDTYDIPPPRPPKPPQNPLDRLVEEQDPINMYDTDEEVCKLSEMGTMNQLQVLDLNDND